MKYADLDDYNFELPSHLIAQRPVTPADSAKLLVYRKESDVIEETLFSQLPDYLDTNYSIVFNNTKVIPARLEARRASGGRVELLFLEKVEEGLYRVFLSRHIKDGEVLFLPGNESIDVVRQEEKFFVVRTKLVYKKLLEYLDIYGLMPIPPYIDNPDKESELRKEYQTVFAEYYGSVAAPTASLHFTHELLKTLKDKGITIYFVTLHVGLGTFASLKETNFVTGVLHKERYEVTEEVWENIQRDKKMGKKIIAVGTTVTRTLESVARTGKLDGFTDLFIQPGYEFKIVDALITNFHLPRSSLLLLVSSFIGSREKIMKLYDYAILHEYRFYSFGDGMLIL